jgi:GntR family histidine utilization transcriptional repressor
LPLYRQVKDHILASIASGTLAPGTRVKSENELAEQFGIARMTANRALRELMHDGYLSRVPGVGTFVREMPHQSSLMELRNIAEEIAARGRRHSAALVRLDKVAADRARAAAFAVARGTLLYAVVLVHAENGIPVQLERRYVNPAIAPFFLRQDFTRMTPTAYLLSVAPLDELEHRVRAVLPDAEARRRLGIEASEPCLELYRRSWSGGVVVTEATLLYPASRYELASRHRTSPSGRLASRQTEDCA